MAKSKKITAAGGVVWRVRSENGGAPEPEVAIIHRPRYDDWSIPKGKLAPGESMLEGALREVFEETGHRAWPGRALGQVHYLKVNDGVPHEKVVTYWAMRAAGGLFTPNREVDELRWVSPDDAQTLLSRATDREVLERFSSGPLLTRTVLLVRHASADSRSKWRGEDRLRPLDEKGHAQASELVRLLSRFNVRQIVSADNLRCVQTVQPLSDSIGVPIVERAEISADGFPGHEKKAMELVRTLGDAGEAVAMCSQREVIPELLAELARADQVTLAAKPKVRKASVWSLSFEDSRLIGLELFDPAG